MTVSRHESLDASPPFGRSRAHVAQGRAAHYRARASGCGLVRGGHDATEARKLVDNLLAAQEEHLGHRKRILKMLKKEELEE